MKLGLIVNPAAGVGGKIAQKGSDHVTVDMEKANFEASCYALSRVREALEALLPLKDKFSIVTVAGNMGANLMKELGFTHEVVYTPEKQQTTPQDTRHAAEVMLKQQVDLLLFAGGDGTARDICSSVGTDLPTIGVPSGVKMHSGVFGITPAMVASMLRSLIASEPIPIVHREVRDLDEKALQEGMIRVTYHGELSVPIDDSMMQSSKSVAGSDESLVIDIADYVVECMKPEDICILGPGSTTMAITDQLGLDGTLIGVDVVQNGKMLIRDADAVKIEKLLEDAPRQNIFLFVTFMRAQGILFGRGNQQITPKLIKIVLEHKHLRVVSEPSKLESLEGRPLFKDTGDEALDKGWVGHTPVIIGYENTILYPVT